MPKPAKSETANRRSLRFFAIAWLAIVLGITAIGLKSTWRLVAAQFWRATPCTIERFEIVADRDSYPAFKADLLFHYEIDGVRHSGTDPWPGQTSDRDYGNFADLREPILQSTGAKDSIPAGTPAQCFVSRFDPSQASLGIPPHAIGTILAPAVFLGFFLFIGICLLIAAFRRDPGNITTWLLGAAMGFFGAVGLGLLGMASQASLEASKTSGWKHANAKVLWSRIDHVGSGKSYRRICEIFYHYEVNGRSYRSNRYVLGDHADARLITRHPEASTLVIIYDPAKPWRALVEPGLVSKISFIAFLGIGSTALSAFGFFHMWKQRKVPAPPPIQRNERRPRSLRKRSRGRW